MISDNPLDQFVMTHEQYDSYRREYLRDTGANQSFDQWLMTRLSRLSGRPIRDYRTSSDRAATVTDSAHWKKITAETPRGRKILLINKAAGVANLGQLGTEHSFWTHWFPLPTFADGE